MGTYYIVVNQDKREYITPSRFGEGLKLREFAGGAAGTSMATVLLLEGPWAGNKVTVIGDVHNGGLYDIAHEQFTDISNRVLQDYASDFEEQKEWEARRNGAVAELQKQLTDCQKKLTTLTAEFMAKIIAAAGQ